MQCGGFLWRVTVEGHYFWKKVIEDKDFEVFFAKYPKKTKSFQGA